ncbi:MAG: hypothetical protein R2932_31515 [Caldilineaceae bacterium]
MQFARRLRNDIRSGEITCTIRIWQRPRVKVGGTYKLEGGAVVVESIEQISLADITPELAQESGFADVEDLLATAKHGSGDNVYLIRFHFQPL